MNINFLLVFLFVSTHASKQNTGKSELSVTLQRLKIVLLKLQTKQFVIINTHKDSKIQNGTKKNNLTNEGNWKQNQIQELITKENSCQDIKQRQNCDENQRSDKKSVCYFARYNMSAMADFLTPVQRLVNTTLCTHVVYKYYTGLAKNSNNELVFNISADLRSEREKEIKELQNKGIPVLVGFESASIATFCKHISSLISDITLTTNFINEVISKLKINGFDGIDMESTQPACCNVPCTRKNQESFLNFIKLFYVQMKKNNFYLALCIRPFDGALLTKSFDFPEIANHVDWISLLMLDAASHWKAYTGHTSPTDSALSFINTLQKLKTDPKKLLFGFSCYSQSFKLRSFKNNRLGDPVSGPGRPGKIVKYDGVFSFYEICEEIKHKDWQIVRSTKLTNYATRDSLWLSYDDPRSLQYKFQVAKHLGGVAAWHLEMDDFSNLCGCGHFPLLRAAVFPDCNVAECML